MRTISPADLAVLASDHYVTRTRILITDADGVERDLSHRLHSVEIQADIDQPIVQPRIRLHRDGDDGSLSPLDEASPYNRIAGNLYSPLLDAGRRVQILTACTLPGVEPIASDWRLIFDGEIDEWEVQDDPVQIVARDPGGALQDRLIEEAQEYGSEAGVPLETVMQAVIDDTLGPGIVTLYVPESPGFMVTAYKPDEGPLLEALQACAQVVGWDVRYAWRESTQKFELTLIKPDRTKTTPNHTFGPTGYIRITKLEASREGVKNVVQVRYHDSDTDEVESVTVHDASSIARYRRQFMRLVEDEGSPIDTAAEATTMAAAALADLKDPKASHDIELRYWWPVELGDLYRFEPNDLYTTAQEFAVIGYAHRLTPDSQRTTISTRGRPAGGYATWHHRASRRGRDGRDGADGTAYWLITDAAAIKRNQAGAYTPPKVVMSGHSATGEEAPDAYSGRYVIATLSGTTWTDRYTSPADEPSHEYTVPADIDAVRVRLYMAGGTVALLDEVVIPVVNDGKNGPPGPGTTSPSVSVALIQTTGDQGRYEIRATTYDLQARTLEYRYVNYLAIDPHPGWPGWSDLPSGGADHWFPRDGRYDMVIAVQVREKAIPSRLANASALLPPSQLTTFTDVDDARDEAVDTAAGYTDLQAGAAEESAKLYAESQASTAYTNAVSTAELDATTKAGTAKSEAIAAAATDATTKAGQARTGAYSDAITEVEGRGLYNDGYEGFIGRGGTKFTAAQAESQSGALQKADGAYTAAITDTELRGLTEDGFTGVLGGAGGLDAAVAAAQVREPSQNKFGVQAGSEAAYTGVLNALYELTHLHTPLAAAGLIPGQVAACTVLVRSEINGDVQAGLYWWGPSGGMNIDWSADHFSTQGGVQISIPNVTIPATATHVRPVVRRRSNGNAAIYPSQWMLTPGPVPMRFDHPGWRPGRPGEEALPAGTKIYDTVSVPREVARGIRQGEALHNNPISLTPAYQDTPAFVASPGGISYHVELSGASHGQVVRFLDPSPTGAKMYAMVREVVSAPTKTPIGFGNGGFGDPAYVATKSQADQAYDFRYYYNFEVIVLPGGTVKIGFHYRRGGGAWVLAGVKWYEASQTATVFVDLEDMVAGSQFGIQVEDMDGPGGNVSPNEAYWYAAAAPAQKVATAAGLPIPYTVIGGA